MQLHQILDQSYQTFREQAEGVKIILLHPDSRYRSMLVAKLINTPELNVFYYAMGPDDITLQAFIASIAHDMANQVPTFGRHINMLPQEVAENPGDHFDLVLTTFANDLAELSAEPFYLILDEYDRSDIADDVQRFVKRLVTALPDHGRMIINSRSLPRLPWVSLIAQNTAVILKDDEVIMDDFYGTRLKSKDMMEVYALGPGFVIDDNVTVDTWEGHLPRLLFFFALDRPVVTRSEICEAFWPDLEPDQAVNVFHVTKRRLHKALESDALVHVDGNYCINPEIPVYYDVVEFVAALMTGRNSEDPTARATAWQRAIELYRGPFLQGHEEEWIIERREELRTGYLEALTKMANHLISADKPEQALTLFQKGLEEDYAREDIHREVMQLYTQLGRRGEAVAHFQKLSESRNISQETADLYEAILA